MEKLTLRNGKFYRGNEIVPLEFGNKEQIKLIEQAYKRMSEFRSEDGGEVDVTVETKYEAYLRFQCACGSYVSECNDIDDEDDYRELTGDIQCRNCKQTYSLFLRETGELAAKLK